MPAGIKEAFKSPFNKSNPASQFYNLSSYTRSSGSDSLRNEIYQADFNNNYYLGGIPGNNPNRLPSYQPSGDRHGDRHDPPGPTQSYPSLFPTKDRSMSLRYGLPDFRKHEQESDISSTDSSIRYLGEPIHHRQLTPGQPSYEQNVRSPTFPEEEEIVGEEHGREYDECETLIHKVLSNRKCRKILKKLLREDDEEVTLPPYKKTVEGFSSSSNDNKIIGNHTLKNIIIYVLIGLLILCILDLFVKLGQLIK
jgi:hypothetical protein